MSYFQTPELLCRCGRPACDAPQRVVNQLLDKLNLLRSFVNRPVVVTSALRCAYWNKHKGGKPDSEHLTGHAADLAAPTSRERYELLSAALRAGFTRIGIGGTFIHVDVSTEKAAEVVWLY